MSRAARLGLKGLVTVAALALAWRVGAAMSDATGDLRFRAAWLGPVAALHLAILWLLALRLGMTMRVLGHRSPPPSELFRIALASLGVSQVALGSLGGDVARVALLARTGSPWPDAARVVVLDRVIGLVGLVLLGSAALAAALPRRQAWPLLLALAALGAGAAAVAALAARGRARGRIGGEAARLASAMAAAATRPGGWACVALATLSHALSVILFYACARLVDLSPPLGDTLVAVPAGLLAATVPASLGGWGLREVSIAATYRALESPFAGAVPASIAFGLTHVAAGSVGLLSLWRSLSGVAFNRVGNE